MREPNTAIEQIVQAQLSSALSAAGQEEQLGVALEAALHALNEESLSSEEEEFLAEKALDDAIDPVASLIGQRVERAIAAGLAAAGVSEDAENPLDVLVLRSAEGGQLNKVVASLMQHISARKKGGKGRVLLVAAQQLYKKVKQILPVDKIQGLPTVEFSEDGPRERKSTAAVEVVAADIALPRLETKASTCLGRLREDGDVDEDSMQAAWVAGALESIDAAIKPPAGEGEPEVPATIPKDPDDPMIGELFHLKYRIVRRIGRGGFGSVYEAQDERGAGNRVAIKVLSGQAAESAAQQQSFKDEARRVTRLSHPNVVDWKVFDETDEGLPYFVMELVEGEEFEETLQRDRKIEPERAAKLLLQVMDALRAAHHLSKHESILHLDLKPANLLRIPPKQGRGEQLKVLDFGIGQYIGDEVVEETGSVVPAEGLTPADLEGPSTLTFSRPGSSKTTTPGVKRSKGCTPEYASPEQSAHVLYEPSIEPLDGRSDLYSLGVVAFEMLTGQLPFKAKARLDVLRMHREDVAPRVGSMGVKVPRKLARFVDRCLQKDRELRWKDTNEAYQFLHEIVHPPVWKAVAKVTVPIVVLALAIGSWAWATREVLIPAVGLTTIEGTDLGASPLYLGPQNTSAKLTLEAEEGLLPGSTTASWELVRASDAEEIAGWRVEWSGAGTVSLEATSELQGRIEERVELRLDGETLRSQPFSLIWIGADTWEVTELQVGNRALDDVQGMGIDPNATSMDVWISGDARDDLSEVSLQVGTAEPISLSVGTSSGNRTRYRVEVADAGLADGSNTVRWLVRDGAGLTWSQTAELELVRGKPTIEHLAIVDNAGLKDADGASPDANKLLGSFMISPRTSPALRVDLSRPADVSWKVFVDGDKAPQLRGSGQGKRTFEFELSGLYQLLGGEPFRGQIEVLVNEDHYVLHAAGSDRGLISTQLPFSVDDTLPDFLAQWRSGGETREVAIADGSTAFFTNASEAEVVFTRKQPVPMRVEVAWWPAGRPAEVRTRESEVLQNPQAQQVAIPVELGGEGEYELAVRSYRFDAAAQTVGERPDIEELLPMVVDRSAPRARVTGLPQGHVLDSIESAPEVLMVEFDGLAAGTREAAVDLSWRLVRADPDTLSSSGSLGAHDPTAGAAHISLGRSLRDAGDLVDGAYRLEVSGIDSAGNALAPASVAFVIAVSGPEIRLEEPSGVGRWRRDAATGRWRVRVRALDPNGVRQTRCELVAEGLSMPILLEPEPGSSERERSLIGSAALPYTLSQTRVRLAFSSTDLHGAESSWLSPEFELPTIVMPSPERVAVVFGDHEVESMRFVKGNGEFQYLFGGRGDEVENPSFIKAGLASFNEAPRRTRSRSWQVPFSAGAIEDYYLDEREVSVAQYQAFLGDPAGYPNSEHWPPGATPLVERQASLIQELEGLPAELPVTNVGWAEAFAYASWVGKRLPSWVEWEYAVRGGAEYRPYAEYDDEAGMSGKPVEAISPTRAAQARGVAWSVDQRFADLSGNVSEWTATGYDASSGRYPHQWALEDPERLQRSDPTAGHFWVVGGRYDLSRIDFTVADYRPADFKHGTVGFRCALSLADLQDRLGTHSQDGPNFEEQAQ